MDKTEKLKLTKALLSDESVADEIIESYLLIAENKILNVAYPFGNEVHELPQKYEVLQCQLAVHYISKMGAEGQISHTENGINRQYTSNGDIPASILHQITPHCEVIKV